MLIFLVFIISILKPVISLTVVVNYIRKGGLNSRLNVTVSRILGIFLFQKKAPCAVLPHYEHAHWLRAQHARTTAPVVGGDDDDVMWPHAAHSLETDSDVFESNILFTVKEKVKRPREEERLCLHVITYMVSPSEKPICKESKKGGFFCHLLKDFDCLRHDRLLRILHHYYLQSKALCIYFIDSYLNNGFQRVLVWSLLGYKFI